MGVASVVITPKNHIGLALGGYGGRTEYCKGVHDDLFARINYFCWNSAEIGGSNKSSTNQNQLILISLDLVGINSKISDFFIQKIEKIYGIPFNQIIVSCTHTHSGWESLGMLAPGKLGFTGMIKSRLDTRIMIEVWKKIFRGIKIAKQNTEEVLIGYDKIYLPEILAIIRRKPPVFVSKPMGVIKITNKAGKIISLICGFGAHGTIVKPHNVFLSAEWMGAFVRHLGDYFIHGQQSFQNESVSSATNDPNGVFINFLLEAEGDISPFCIFSNINASNTAKNDADYENRDYIIQKKSIEKTPKDIGKRIRYLRKSGSSLIPKSDWELMDNYGKVLASQVFNYMFKINPSPINTINFAVERFLIPLYGKPKSSTIKDVLFYIKDRIQKTILFHLFKMLHYPLFPFINYSKKGSKYFVKGRIVGFRLNDLILISSPGETFHSIAEALYKDAEVVDTNHEKRKIMVQIIGFGNDYMSYLFPIEEFYKGGYENEFQLAPLAGEIVQSELIKIVDHLIYQ
jgi:hypothetical protein